MIDSQNQSTAPVVLDVLGRLGSRIEHKGKPESFQNFIRAGKLSNFPTSHFLLPLDAL